MKPTYAKQRTTNQLVKVPSLLSTYGKKKSIVVIDDVEDYYKPPPPMQTFVVVQDESDHKSIVDDIIVSILGPLNSHVFMPLILIAGNLLPNTNIAPSSHPLQ